MSVRKTVLIRDVAVAVECLRKRLQKERVRRICNVLEVTVLRGDGCALQRSR